MKEVKRGEKRVIQDSDLRQAGDCRDGEQVCRKGHWGLCRQQAELAACPDSKDNQLHPGLYEQEHDW